MINNTGDLPVLPPVFLHARQRRRRLASRHAGAFLYRALSAPTYPLIGHDLPQEAPGETAAAMLELLRSSDRAAVAGVMRPTLLRLR